MTCLPPLLSTAPSFQIINLGVGHVTPSLFDLLHYGGKVGFDRGGFMVAALLCDPTLNGSAGFSPMFYHHRDGGLEKIFPSLASDL